MEPSYLRIVDPWYTGWVDTLSYRILDEMTKPLYRVQYQRASDSADICAFAEQFLGPDSVRVFNMGRRGDSEQFIAFKCENGEVNKYRVNLYYLPGTDTLLGERWNWMPYRSTERFQRLDGPAVREWWPNGNLKQEAWYVDGKEHREDGPAYEEWYENGQKKQETWKQNDKTFRADGPAKIRWSPDGQVIEVK